MDDIPSGVSVRDLAEMAGTTVRTIHYYISEGLLPPPAGATRSATYSPAHLARLLLIGALRDEGLALASIRQRVAPLTDDEALEVVAELDEHLGRTEETALTTLGLIEAALASRQSAPGVNEPAMPASPSHARFSNAMPFEERAPAGGAATVRESASAYLSRLRGKPPARDSALRPLPSPRTKPPLKKPPNPNQPEIWHHFQIEDGIEVRVREDRYRESTGRLRAVIDSVRASLQRYGVTRSNIDDV